MGCTGVGAGDHHQIATFYFPSGIPGHDRPSARLAQKQNKTKQKQTNKKNHTYLYANMFQVKSTKS